MTFRNISDLSSAICNKNVAELGLMASKLAYYNYEWRFNTAVIFNMLVVTCVNIFLTNYDRSILVRMGKYESTYFPRNNISQFVIYAENVGELIDFVLFLIEKKSDATAKYILVCTSDEDEDCDENTLFSALVESHVSNIVLLKLHSGSESAAYTYYPFVPGICWNQEPVRLNITLGCRDDQCFKSQFPEKFFNLYQCKLTVSTIQQPPFMKFTNKTDGKKEIAGSDWDILNLIVGMINGTLELKTPSVISDWGHFVNNNWTGSLGQVYNREAIFSICSSPLTPGKYGNFQISFTYDSMDFVWVAGRPKPRPSWEKLLRPVDFHVRMALLLTFIGIIVLNTFTRTKLWNILRKVLDIAPLRLNLLLYSWVLFLGLPASRVPKRLFFQILFCTWIWFSLIFRSVYQGALVGSLKVQVLEDYLQTFQDVLRNRYPFGGMPGYRDYYLENDDRRIYDQWKVLSYEEAIRELSVIADGSSDFVLCLNREHLIDFLVNSKSKKQVQVIPEKVANSPVVIYFKKKSHFAHPVNRYLTVIVEGGFTQRMYGRYVAHVKQLFHPDKFQLPEALRLQHFTGCFAVLIFGWIIALIYFLVEYACGRDELHE